jgi:hypothetical protein
MMVNHFKAIWIVTILLMGGLIGIFQAPVSGEDESPNPYEGVRLSRLSLIEGEVLLQRGDDEEWFSAAVNMPLRPYDKIWATDGARTEIQFDGGTMVRLAENTNLDLLDLTPGRVHLQLTLGVANINVHSVSGISPEGYFFELNTPQAAILANRSTKFRVNVTEDGSTEITVREGEIKLSSDEEPVVVGKGQRVVIESRENPRYQLESAGGTDEWDRWNESRDDEIARAVSGRYLSPDISMGVLELDAYGQWVLVPDYGRVWMPRVSAGWVPYYSGRWVWIEPWGWTWVSYEPWGWIPYHYGRWVTVSQGWVWVPGSRREVWMPGSVRFIQGPDWVAWVPLAPGERYYYNPGRSVRVDSRLINYRVPGAVTVLPRQTFVTGNPVHREFTPPVDPVRSGRIVAGPPPVLPTPSSLRPKMGEGTGSNFQPPRVINRPVVYHNPAPAPPARFDDRVNKLHEVILQGRPPVAAPQGLHREKHLPGVEGRRLPERIQKDIIVHKTIREPVRELPRSLPRPPSLEREQPRMPGGGKERPRPQPQLPRNFELKKEVPGQPEKARPLYRKPPRPLNSREIK